MIKPMYCIYDSVSQVYDRPFPAFNDEDAKRSVAQIVNDSNHPIGRNPEHFSLWNVGEWDDNKGDFLVASPIQCVCKCVELAIPNNVVQADFVDEAS